MQFNRQALEKASFVGWSPLVEIRNSLCPASGGVYIISYEACGPIEFSEVSCGGRFKGKDPTVSLRILAANWVNASDVVYIGKADNLRRRLAQFADFGAGRPVGHWGGRLIWQLPQTDNLQVAWKETPDRIPIKFEAEMIGEFGQLYGKPPFANDPQRLGH